MFDMLLVDILLSFLGMVVIRVILAVAITPILESSDHTVLENISYTLAFLYFIYLATELTVFVLHLPNQISPIEDNDLSDTNHDGIQTNAKDYCI